MITPDDVTPQALAHSIDPASLARGMDYFDRDRAAIDDVFEYSDRVSLYAECLGSGGRMYEQSVTLWKEGRLEVDGLCSCPVGFNCKHVAAACLTWAALDDDALEPVDPVQDWLSRLAPDEPQSSEDSRPGAQALLYELAPSDYMSPDSPLAINLIIARRKKNGEWGKGRGVSAFSIGGHYLFGRPDHLTDTDVEIAALLRAMDDITPGFRHGLRGKAGSTVLRMMLATERLFLRSVVGRVGPLRPGADRQLTLQWQADPHGTYRLRLDTGVRGPILAETSPPHYIDQTRLEIGALELPAGLRPDSLPLLESAPEIAREDAPEISRRIALQHPGLPTPEPVVTKECREPVRPRARLHFNPVDPATSRLTLAMSYGEAVVSADSPANPVTIDVGDHLLQIFRDIEGEDRARETLETLGLQPDAPATTFYLAHPPTDAHQALGRWMHLLDEDFPRLQEEGWDIDLADDEPLSLRRGEQINANVEREGNDWFDLRFDLMVDGESVPLLPLVDQILGTHEPDNLPETLYLETEPGQYLKVAGEQIAPVLETIISLHDRASATDSLRLARPDAPRLLDLGETVVHGGESMLDLARRLQGFEGIRSVTPPETFHATLRPYQHQGLDWLQFLREYDFGGILADDMGLGKTVQTLAHLAVEKAASRLDRPALIVAPTSLMGNWRRETEQFAPDLDVLVFHGPDRGRHVDALDTADIVLTTYPLLARDQQTLSERAWHIVILDEAQQIKNPRSQAARVVRQLDTRHRLCLTGTPMENHLGELWAQFDFLIPGFLGDQKSFSQRYRTPVEKHGDQPTLARLRRRVRPFMLRRTKDQVAKELPEKTEMLRTVALGGGQATLYESIRLTMEKRVREAIAKKGMAKSHITVLDALLKLRQVCCDPRLLAKTMPEAGDVGSAKLALLMELLPEMLEEGRRILLFSQFTTMLGLIEQALREREIPFSKLTGQTKKRDEAIDRFRRGEANVFLISLKAGGVGLNLTEADTVIHFDPWWNPAAEAQATDRAHRIGQERPVFVYKLVTEGTVEEKILDLQARKQRLVGSVHGSDSTATNEPPIDEATIQALLNDA